MDLLVAQNVYSLSCQGAVKLFEIASRFPPNSHKSLRDSILSSSSRICDNLLNAWQNRSDDGIFNELLERAIINVKQTMHHIDNAVIAGLLKADDAKLITTIYQRVDEKINNLKDKIGQ